jgi:adenosylhomocysteine nucleosidase
MAILTVVPTERELEEILDAFRQRDYTVEFIAEGRLPLYRIPNLDLCIASGGLGKTQFAVQTQYLIDRRTWALVVCAGAAGALVDDVDIGDVVVGTETIEHDIRKVGRPLVPRFAGDEATVARCRATFPPGTTSRVHYGGIASGDEDVVDVRRRVECQRITGALVVAWEGAGAARACAFSGVPFVEIRAVADRADQFGPQDFARSVRTAMQAVTMVVNVVAGGAV